MNQYQKESSRYTLGDYVQLLFKTLRHSRLMGKALKNATWTLFLMEQGYELTSYREYDVEYFDMLVEEENREVIRQLVDLGLDLEYRHNFEPAKRLYEDENYGEEAFELCRNPPYRSGRTSFAVDGFYKTVEAIGYEEVEKLRNERGWHIKNMLDLLKLREELGEEEFEKAAQFLEEYVSDGDQYSSLGTVPLFKIEVVEPYVDELRELHSLDSKEQSGKIRFSGNVTGVGFRGNTSLTAEAFGLPIWEPGNYGATVIAEYTSKPELLDFFINYLETESKYKDYIKSHQFLP